MLWSSDEIQGVGTDDYAVSGSGVTDGHWCKPFVVVGGFAPSGLNVNNYDYDNEKLGVAGWRKFG